MGTYKHHPSALPTLEEAHALTELMNQEAAKEAEFGTEDGNYDLNQAFEAARTNMDFFAALAIPDVYKYAFPPLFLTLWQLVTSYLLKTRDFTQLALGLPRGFGKTLVVKLIILWAILFTKKRFILVISENEEKAISIISDVCDMLNEPNIKAVFGDWTLGIQSNNAKKKVFSYRGREILLKPAGASSGIRGITEKNRRPDLMIFDDIQSREESESDLVSQQLERWLYGTAMKAKSPEGCLFLFIANMYPTRGSLLRKIKGNPNWIKFIVGGILEDGTSLWEDLQPIAQLTKEFINDLESGNANVFFAEVLNDEHASANSKINTHAIPRPAVSRDDIHQGSFVIIDPSSGQLGRDAVTIGGYQIFDARPLIRHLDEGSFSPGETVKRAIRMALRMGSTLIVVESNAYQSSLKYWLDLTLTQLGIFSISVVPMHSGFSSKNSRILEMFKAVIKGELWIHDDVRAMVTVQMQQFNPLKRDNVDGILDVMTMAPRVLTEFSHLIALPGNQDADRDDSLLNGSSQDALEDFSLGSPF